MSEHTTAWRIDVETLLAPISIEHPTGESLRYEGTYDRIQEARREDDPTLAQGIWKTPLKKANWAEVRDFCLEALETRSKDLQLAVWLLEAWLHLHGFAGVREGAQLLYGLCESFWDELYPQWDAENPEYRFSPLVWMNEKLALQLKQLPITQPQTGDVPAYSYADWESALRLETLAAKDAQTRQAAEAAGKPTQARFLGSVTLSPTAFYVTLNREVQTILETLTALERFLDAQCGSKAPGLARFKEILRAIERLVEGVLRERADHGEDISVSAEEHADPGILQDYTPDDGYVSVGSPIRSRAEAYRRLSEAADYLLRTEPHSPAPYLVKRAVAWGSMTLTELLQEFVHNPNDLYAIYALLGIREGGGQER